MHTEAVICRARSDFSTERSFCPAATEPERADLLIRLAAALFAAGSFERGTTVAEEAVLTSAPLAAPGLNARAVIERERLRLYQEQATIDVPATIAIVDAALATLTALGDDLGQARAHYLRCELAWMDGGDIDAAHASAESMLACAHRAGSGFEASAAVGFMAWGLALGRTPATLALERCRSSSSTGSQATGWHCSRSRASEGFCSP